MTDTRIEVPYNDTLQPLERILEGVQRPGDCFVHGSLEAPLPRIEVEGVGVLSFPVPEAQAQALIAHSERAPYGRGAETLLDTSVRKVWQLAPSKLTMGGKSWPRIFEQILSAVAAGLGCDEANVSAELYKLLVYDAGAFFKAHRDTEKAEGMFGTLLIVLPSVHAGGELVVRHAEREVTLDLSSADASELVYAAFYADCEHEVLPVTGGYRVCLVYNLRQQRGDRDEKQPSLIAPVYDAETAATAELLVETFAGGEAPAKIAWLLEHQYSPAGLSFEALKNGDAARARVLRAATTRADCALHLGIVHIEEYGSADCWSGRRYSSGRRGHSGHDDEYVSTDEFQVIEVQDGYSYIDHWLNVADGAVGFGELPLNEGEVLPSGALDGEAPDEQRVTEATGNEGASFERSYHRAALVVWPRLRFVDVLLQAGVRAVLPYLEERTRVCGGQNASDDECSFVLTEARRVLDAWERGVVRKLRARGYVLDFASDRVGENGEDDDDGDGRSTSDDLRSADRARMVTLLARLADAELLERFVDRVVMMQFNGNEEAAALAGTARLLEPKRCGELFTRLAQLNMRAVPRGCVSLFARLVREQHVPERPDWTASLLPIGTAIVEGLFSVGVPASCEKDAGAGLPRLAESIDATMLVDLLEGLATLEAPQLCAAACIAVIANGNAFDACLVLVPALRELRERTGTVFGNTAGERLWRHAADVLLTRGEYPPKSPQDWRQNIELSCNCADCRQLRTFAADPVEQTYRFRVRKDRRAHLHGQIDRHRLDMMHVTERTGSPQTLVCTKTRRTYERRREAYRQDVKALAILADLVETVPGDLVSQCARIAAARQRAATEFRCPL